MERRGDALPGAHGAAVEHAARKQPPIKCEYLRISQGSRLDWAFVLEDFSLSIERLPQSGRAVSLFKRAPSQAP